MPEDPEQGRIRLDDEFYSIELVFEVASTAHNYERGNIFVQSQFNSYRKGMQPLVIARTGYLDPKSGFRLLLNDLYSMMPFTSACPNTQRIAIKIFDKFDNDDFGLESIDFLIPHEALQFKQAHINVRISLYGFRYYMHDWFFTCAFVIISCLTCSICVGVLVGVVVLK